MYQLTFTLTVYSQEGLILYLSSFVGDNTGVLSVILLLPFSVQGSVFRRIDALLGEFRVGGGVHDSYTFQCGLVRSFTSPGIDTR